MLKQRNKKLILLTLLFFSILILGLFQKINYSFAQEEEEEESLVIPRDFELKEFPEIIGKKENVTSIDIDLGADRYNITSIELNFTNIRMERQIKNIEDEDLGYDVIVYYKKTGPTWKLKTGLGVQLELKEDTMLYGAYIYGYKASTITKNITIQIRGYDNANNNPNNSIYLSKILNMSYERDWYYQNFTKFLSKGNYYLVLNGSDIPYNELNYYYWGLNTFFPKNPLLYSSVCENKTGPNPTWSNGAQSSPFLYKLDQKINQTYYPEEIRMKAKINGDWQNITDGSSPGIGNLTLNNINFPSNEEILHIPIENNESMILNFTINYRINLINFNFTQGTLKIGQHFNEWNFHPTIDKTLGNYSVKFMYPKSWENLTIQRNTGLGFVNITDDADKIDKGNLPSGEHFIIIKNNTIEKSYQWNITVYSPKINFNAIINKISFSPGEKLIINLTTPVLVGDYTIVLFNDEIKQQFPPSYNLTYNLPDVPGNSTIFIFWNNETDAGEETQEFSIIGLSLTPGGGGDGGNGNGDVITGLDPLLVFIISMIIIIAVVAGLASYQTIKRTKAKRELYLKKLHNKFMDILSLNYIMILDKKSGINVYEQFFAGKLIDATLISGFLEAIRNFGIELTGTYQQSQTVKLEYQNSKILMSEFREFRVILVLKENVSDDFITSINALSYDIETQYGQELKDFKGKTSVFEDIKTLIEKHLNISFISPLKVFELPNIELSPTEQSMINKAKSIMKQNNLDFFYTTFLMEDQKFDPKKTNAIFNLIEKKIFQPTSLPSEAED